MRATEYIKERYKIALETFDQTYEKETSYDERKTHNFIITATDIGYLLQTYQQSKLVESVDNADRLFRFEEVLDDLLHNSMLENIKPVTKLWSKEGYGYKQFEYENELMMILQFLEEYLDVQTPKSDVIYWIELGVKLKLIDVTIEIK
jgi:hypothetical protein